MVVYVLTVMVLIQVNLFLIVGCFALPSITRLTRSQHQRCGYT